MDKRILFAVARGAQVQVQLSRNCGWINSTQLTWHDDCIYRIHPDQLEYQYGPISTALREISQQDIHYLQDSTGVYEQAAIEDYAAYGELGYCWDNAANATAMHKSLFLLILAEALADEGM
jgi:hypothetical protein